MQTKERKSYAVASSQAFASKGLLEFFFFNPASFLLHDPCSDTRTPHLVHGRFEVMIPITLTHGPMSLLEKNKIKDPRNQSWVTGKRINEVTLSHLVS